MPSSLSHNEQVLPFRHLLIDGGSPGMGAQRSKQIPLRSLPQDIKAQTPSAVHVGTLYHISSLPVLQEQIGDPQNCLCPSERKLLGSSRIQASDGEISQHGGKLPARHLP
jgi:hypothetical protein